VDSRRDLGLQRNKALIDDERLALKSKKRMDEGGDKHERPRVAVKQALKKR
jgi:hypothetical protein